MHMKKDIFILKKKSSQKLGYEKVERNRGYRQSGWLLLPVFTTKLKDTTQ